MNGTIKITWAAYLLGAAFNLTGCLTAPDLGAPTNPKPDVIKARVDHLTTIANTPVGDFDPKTNQVIHGRTALLSPSEYARAGYTVVNEACNSFFDALSRKTNGNQLTKADWTALGTATATILALTHTVSTKPVGVAAAAFGLGAVAYDNYQKYALLTPYPDQTRTLVRKALDAYAVAAPAEKADDMIGADARISGYAMICTYSNITALAQNAISTGTATASNATTTPPSIFTSQAEITEVHKIENLLGIPSISDDDLAKLAQLADAIANPGTAPAPPKTIASTLSAQTQSVVWNSSTDTPLAAFSSAVIASLTTLKSNPVFAKMISDSNASSVAANTKALADATAAGTPAPPKLFIAPVNTVTSWHPPSILVNAEKTQQPKP